MTFNNPLKVFAAWSIDENSRKRSASGGVAGELYNYCVTKGIYTVGVEMNQHDALYKEVLNKSDIESVRNSKYVYSNTKNIYKKIKQTLENGKEVLFIGLPCQVAGLKCFLQKKYDNLSTIDLICHGVVPVEYLRQHIERIEKKSMRKSQCIFFRDPEFDTSTYTFSIRDDISVFYKKKGYENDLYQIGFHKGLILRDNCYNCKYAQRGRVSDLSLGDFDSIGKVKPVLFDKKNINCILVNTQKGIEILENVKEKLFIQERPINEELNYEPQLNQPLRPHPQRDIFVAEYKKNHNFHRAASIGLKNELVQYKKEHPSPLHLWIRMIKIYISQQIYKWCNR